jgi:Protein of unknown function (DUF2934)
MKETLMVTKRVSPAKKTVRPKATNLPELTDGAAMAVLESAQLASRTDPDLRRQLIAAEAYFLAERRGFAAGRELDDWAAAEAVVDSRLRQMQVA